MTSRTRHGTGSGELGDKPFVPRNVRGRRGPKCHFLGRKAPSVALVAREWPCSPLRQPTAPTRETKTARCGQPAPELREGKFAEGVFVEEGTEKYTIGTEVGRKCLISGEMEGTFNRRVFGKTPFASQRSAGRALLQDACHVLQPPGRATARPERPLVQRGRNSPEGVAAMAQVVDLL